MPQWQLDEACVDRQPRRLDQLLELSNPDFQKLNRVLGGDLLSLEGSRKLECRLELAGEGFEAVNDVLWDVRRGLRLVVLIVVKYCKGRFGGPRVDNTRGEDIPRAAITNHSRHRDDVFRMHPA